MKNIFRNTLLLCSFLAFSGTKAQFLKKLKEQVQNDVDGFKNVAKGNLNGAAGNGTNNLFVNPASDGLIVKLNNQVLTGVISFYKNSSPTENLFFKIESPSGDIKYVAKSQIRAFIYGNRKFYNSWTLDEKITTNDVIFERLSDGDCKLYFGYRFGPQLGNFTYVESIMTNKNNEALTIPNEYFGSNPEIKKWMLTNFSDYKPLIEYINNYNTKDAKPLKYFFDAYNSKSLDPLNSKPATKPNQDLTVSNQTPDALNGTFIRDTKAQIILEPSINPTNRTNILLGELNIGYYINVPASNDADIYSYNTIIGKDMLVGKYEGSPSNYITTTKDNKKYKFKFFGAQIQWPDIVSYLVKNGYL